MFGRVELGGESLFADNPRRMLLALAALLTMFQRLDPPPRVSHPGEPVVLCARNASGQPVSGITVRVRVPSGSVQVVGAADERGEVEFVATETGEHVFRASFPGGPVVMAVYNIVARPRRWLYALLLTPIGLWLIWWNLKNLRRGPE